MKYIKQCFLNGIVCIYICICYQLTPHNWTEHEIEEQGAQLHVQTLTQTFPSFISSVQSRSVKCNECGA